MATSTSKPDNKKLDALHKEFERLGLRGYWENRGEAEPLEPHLWRWADVHPVLMQAADVVAIGDGRPGTTFRRNIGASVPGQGLGSVSMGFQVVMPGETAAVHHHTATAMRFGVIGNGTYTTANEERMMIEPGGLLVQPNWAWHGHGNLTDEPTIWLDILNVGLVNFLHAQFREEWAEGDQPITKPDGFSVQRYQALRPPTALGDPDPPAFSYGWAETIAALEAADDDGEDDEYDGVLLDYTNPVTGGPTTVSIQAQVQMLRPGEETKPHRHTGSTRHHVVRGKGVTTVGKDGETELAWSEKDLFYVPPWSWHQHRNESSTEPAILFSVNDYPLLKSLGMYREELG